MMYYRSTRNAGLKMKSAEAIKKGLSEEGGLFVPCEIPVLTDTEWKKMIDMPYIERANLILRKYLTDFTAKEIAACTEAAYGGNKFSSDKVAPVVKLNNNQYILELWHGPTCAFKDMALQILPHFMTAAMKKTGEDKTVVILVATSGDTGKAALEGFKDVAGTRIIVFYPGEGVSDMQKLQMMTQEGANVFVSGIYGNFDDAQSGVKAIFTNEAENAELEKAGYILSSANSINWGRLVPQIVYYISAYCDMVHSGELTMGEKINVCVPTGNFGNILAAYYARKMGLPVHKLICASNQNNVLTDFIHTGEYNRNRDFYASVSPSMDILISSNLERLLFDISGCDDKRITTLMNKLNKSGSYQLPKTLHKKVTDLFWGGFCDDYFTKVRIWKTFTETGYTLDTHTAVAVDVYEQYVNETGDYTKTLIASTASPYKFNRVVLSALGEDSDEDDLTLTERLRDKCHMEIPASLSALRGKERRFTTVAAKEDMYSVIRDFLQVEEQLASVEKKEAENKGKVQKESVKKGVSAAKSTGKKEAASKAEEMVIGKSAVAKAEKKPVRRQTVGAQAETKPMAEKKDINK
ncbi:threonine synthase [Ructibacterium gallinarum]|nr:threonine synthase [Ructibacterium gallinarum]